MLKFADETLNKFNQGIYRTLFGMFYIKSKGSSEYIEKTESHQKVWFM